MKELVALDWGTSSLRAARIAPDGRVLEESALPHGILTVPPGQFAPVFIAAVASWARPGGRFALISGMAGSRQGWLEAPYRECPAGFADVAAGLARVEPAPEGWHVSIVPGLSRESEGVPDVMRGEETQVFGAMQLLGLDRGTFVLPGTHSKWVRVAAGRIEGFTTFMTGEFYALLRRHSILSRTLPEQDGELDEAAFLRGVAQAARGPLLATAFSARTLSLFGRMSADELASYLSGLVIGEEMRAQDFSAAREGVVLIGAPVLVRRYQLALEAHGVRSQAAPAEATWRGLWAIARTLED